MLTMTDHQRRAHVRAILAGAEATRLGITGEDRMKIVERSYSETLAGYRNGTESFAGKVSIGTRPDGAQSLGIYTYTGLVVDPLATGIDGASTLD